MGCTNVQTSDTYYSWNSDQLSMAWQVALPPSTASTVFCLYHSQAVLWRPHFLLFRKRKRLQYPQVQTWDGTSDMHIPLLGQ